MSHKPLLKMHSLPRLLQSATPRPNPKVQMPQQYPPHRLKCSLTWGKASACLHASLYRQDSCTETHTYLSPLILTKTVRRTEGKIGGILRGGDQYQVWCGRESHREAHPSVMWHLFKSPKGGQNTEVHCQTKLRFSLTTFCPRILYVDFKKIKL